MSDALGGEGSSGNGKLPARPALGQQHVPLIHSHPPSAYGGSALQSQYSLNNYYHLQHQQQQQQPPPPPPSYHELPTAAASPVARAIYRYGGGRVLPSSILQQQEQQPHEQVLNPVHPNGSYSSPSDPETPVAQASPTDYYENAPPSAAGPSALQYQQHPSHMLPPSAHHHQRPAYDASSSSLFTPAQAQAAPDEIAELTRRMHQAANVTSTAHRRLSSGQWDPKASAAGYEVDRRTSHSSDTQAIRRPSHDAAYGHDRYRGQDPATAPTTEDEAFDDEYADGEDEDDEDEEEDDDEDGDEDNDQVLYDDDDAVPEAGEGKLVRQNSSFARLSADSWLTVVSEYENDGPNENLLFAQVEEEPKNSAADAAAVSEMHAVSALAGRSVLDCVVDLLKGTRAQKRKMLRRYGERWIWLGEDLLSLNWKSKKRGVDTGKLNLTKVKKLRSVDRELIVETTDSHKLALTLATRDEAITWLTGLSCLVPKKAKVFETNKQLMARVNYDPLRDSWRGKPVSTRKRVNEYIMLGGIGKGSFGKVKLALSTLDKRFYACKIITNHRRNNGASSLSNREEQAVLRKLDHPNIVKHRDVLYDGEEDRYCLVIEYMARGVVMDSSKLEGVKPLSEDGVREIMRDVVAGLEYLHFQRIVHRDIKPDNLLRCGDGTVKISDFGEARMYEVSSVDQNRNAAPGTPAFIAPELCMSDKSPKAPPESYAADVWSLGASLFYMVYGRAPFLAKSVFEIYDAICTQKLRFPDQPKVSRKLKDLIKKMLTKEPKSRATLKEVAAHTWFGDRVTPGRLTKIRITQEDIDNAIGHATWKIPAERQQVE